jgi:hypothetical protein
MVHVRPTITIVYTALVHLPGLGSGGDGASRWMVVGWPCNKRGEKLRNCVELGELLGELLGGGHAVLIVSYLHRADGGHSIHEHGVVVGGEAHTAFDARNLFERGMGCERMWRGAVCGEAPS